MSRRARCRGSWTGSLERNVGLPAEAHHTLARSGRGTDTSIPLVSKNSYVQSFLEAPECDIDAVLCSVRQKHIRLLNSLKGIQALSS